MAGTNKGEETCAYGLKVDNEKLRLHIKRLEKEIEEYNSILTDTQSELDLAQKDCDNYIAWVHELNSRLVHQPKETVAEKSEDKNVVSLENELAETKTRLEVYMADLGKAEKRVKNLTDKEWEYKEKLGMDKEESPEAIGYKIEQLKRKNRDMYEEKKELLSQLKKIQREKLDAQADIEGIGREKDRLRFLMRQQEMTMKRMQRDIRVQPISKTKTSSKPKKTKPERKLSIFKGGLRDLRTESHVCVICKKTFVPADCPTPCRFHHGSMEVGRWTCCSEKSDRSQGCIEINHLYIQFDDDKRAHLTDGHVNMMVFRN